MPNKPVKNIREIVIDADGPYTEVNSFKEKQKTMDKARILITIAVYLITAGTLMDYVSTPVMMKTIGFILAGHAFFYLWKSSK